MICYVLAMRKQHLGPHVVVGFGIKFFWPGLFITSPDHLEKALKSFLHIESNIQGIPFDRISLHSQLFEESLFCSYVVIVCNLSFSPCISFE